MDIKVGWVYIMASESGTLYTGVTSDLQFRVFQHKKHLVPGFTAKYRCEKLVFFERLETIGFAIAREKEIKGLRRSRKQNLIRQMNPSWKDLAADWYWEEPASRQEARGPSPREPQIPPELNGGAQDDGLAREKRDEEIQIRNSQNTPSSCLRDY